MSFRAKNHHLKQQNTPKTPTQPHAMPSQNEQEQLEHALSLQQQGIRQVDKVLMFIFPTMAFLLSVMTANFNIPSTIGTFVIAWIAFYAVGIRQQSVFIWLAVVIAYTIADNFFSYQHAINMDRLMLPLGSLVAFLIIIHIFRPMLNTWFVKSKLNATPK